MFFQETEVQEVDTDDLEEAASDWLNVYRREIAAKTTGRRLTSMRCLANALGLEILKKYNAPTPAAPNPHPLPGGMTDLEKLLDQCNTEQQQALIALTGFGGLRISEARSIIPSNFDLHHMDLHVIAGKGAKDRDVPISDRAWEVLALPYAMSRLAGGIIVPLVRMSDRTARAFITTAGTRAGIGRAISSHDLRATFATEAYRHTKDIRAVQILMGHSSVTQTQTYVATSREEMRKAANFSPSRI